MSTGYDDEQLLEAIAAAIRVHDFDAVAALTRRLAVQNPQAAQDVLDIVAMARLAGA